MKTLSEITAELNAKKEGKAMQSHQDETSMASAAMIVKQLERLKEHWSDLSDKQQLAISQAIAGLPTPQTNINFQGIEKIAVEAASIVGMEKYHEEMVKAHQDMMTDMKKMHRELISAISLIEVNVPEPKVTVNVPDIKIPAIKAPEVRVTQPNILLGGLERKLDQMMQLLRRTPEKTETEEKPLKVETKRGRYNRIEEIITTYSSGQVITRRNGDTWETDDRRK